MFLRLPKLIIYLAFFFFTVSASAQSYSLRTNVIGLVTTNLNIEASMTVNDKWSLHIPVQYNPFRYTNNKQFKNIYCAPGTRYWFLQSYIGTFIGVYGTFGKYSVGNIFGNHNRYEGTGYGLSVSVGKAYQLGKNWNIEWEVGAGPMWLRYEKYECKECGDWIEDKAHWTFMPSRIAVNFVYLF